MSLSRLKLHTVVEWDLLFMFFRQNGFRTWYFSHKMSQNSFWCMWLHISGHTFCKQTWPQKKCKECIKLFSRKQCGQGETVATASNLREWTLSRRVCCKGTSCSRTRLQVMTFRVARCIHTGDMKGIQLTQMGCVRNSNPGTNRHEPLCVLRVLQGHQYEAGGGLADPNQNCSPSQFTKLMILSHNIKFIHHNV